MGTTDPRALAVEEYEAETGHTPTPEPAIPVFVVDPVRVEEYPARTIVTDQVPVAGVAVRVAGELRTRASLTLAARGGDVYVGPVGVTTGTGFLIPDGAALTIESTDGVYAVSTGAATVHVLAQVREG